MFQNQKLFKNFMILVKSNQSSIEEIMDLLHTLPNKVVRKIGKTMIYSDYDGYNELSKSSELAYFDNLDRFRKEHYIETRLYKLY